MGFYSTFGSQDLYIICIMSPRSRSEPRKRAIARCSGEFFKKITKITCGVYINRQDFLSKTKEYLIFFKNDATAKIFREKEL